VSVHGHLLERREHYPVLARSTYLASHTLGAMHRDTPQRLAEYARMWAERGVVAWEDWAPEVVRVADLVGSLVGAPPGTTVMRQNVADLLGDVVTALDWQGERNRLVTDALDWPGSLQAFSQLSRLGGQPVVVPGDPDGIDVDLSRLLEAVDERTRLVYVSHVLFRTSTVVDVGAVVARAHAVGALVMVDGYQAAGTLVPCRSTSWGWTWTSTWAARSSTCPGARETAGCTQRPASARSSSRSPRAGSARRSRSPSTRSTPSPRASPASPAARRACRPPTPPSRPTARWPTSA
jgi:kynureninase